jgi:hypothetical protein
MNFEFPDPARLGIQFHLSRVRVSTGQDWPAVTVMHVEEKPAIKPMLMVARINLRSCVKFWKIHLFS